MSSFVRPAPEELLPLFPELLPRSIVEPLVKASGVKLYWRLLTPLVILWGFIFQRLSSDHTCDAMVSHLQSGAADHLVPVDPMAGPLSKRLTSESTSAYVQGRNRLPLSVLQGALHHVFTVLTGWLRAKKRHHHLERSCRAASGRDNLSSVPNGSHLERVHTSLQPNRHKLLGRRAVGGGLLRV